MPAAKHDIKIDQGSDCRIDIQIFENDAVKNLVGYGARAQMRQQVTSPNAIQFDTTGSQFDVNGIVQIRLDNVTSQGIEAGSYVYDVELFTKALDLSKLTPTEIGELSTFIQRISVGLESVTSQYEYLIDFDADGDVDLSDYTDFISPYIAVNLTQAEKDEVLAALTASNSGTYTTTIREQVNAGTPTQAVTRIIQGNATVTAEVTR